MNVNDGRARVESATNACTVGVGTKTEVCLESYEYCPKAQPHEEHPAAGGPREGGAGDCEELRRGGGAPRQRLAAQRPRAGRGGASGQSSKKAPQRMGIYVYGGRFCPYPSGVVTTGRGDVGTWRREDVGTSGASVRAYERRSGVRASGGAGPRPNFEPTRWVSGLTAPGPTRTHTHTHTTTKELFAGRRWHRKRGRPPRKAGMTLEYNYFSGRRLSTACVNLAPSE